METIGAIALILLVLACPLSMLAIGGVVWIVARARGEKKDFSVSCMQHGEHRQTSAPTEESTLRDQVAQLQAEVESLKAQASAPSGADIAPAPAGANGHKVPEEVPGSSDRERA